MAIGNKPGSEKIGDGACQFDIYEQSNWRLLDSGYFVAFARRVRNADGRESIEREYTRIVRQRTKGKSI